MAPSGRFLRASPAHLQLAANSRAVLDLPHPLSKTLEEGAPAVLQLVANVGNDVARGEVASAGEAAVKSAHGRDRRARTER